jgi:hypothetical protein
MGIHILVTVKWDDDKHYVMLISYRKGWTWADHTRARADIDAMAASVPHTIDVIADVIGANQLPGGSALNEMTAALHAAPPNIGMIVVVGSSFVMRAVLQTVKTVTFNQVVSHIFLANTVDEARSLIRQRRQAA